MNISEIQRRLRECLPGASPAVRRAVEWLTLHTPEIAWTGVDVVARESGVSPATIIRAVHAVGFDGYLELQKLVRAQSPTSDLAWRLFQGDQSEDQDLVGAVIAQEVQNLHQLGPLLRPQLDPLVTWLLARPRMVVTASLMTTDLAEHVALHLRLLLGRVEFVDASSSQAWLQLRDLEATDGVIGLSYPRYSRPTTRFLTGCQQHTPHILWMTDLSGPDLPQAELTIRLPSVSLSHYSSTVSLMALVHILARELAERDPARVRANLDAADGLWHDLSRMSRDTKDSGRGTQDD